MRVRPDDEVYRVKTVWHGPKGLTFPWTARYLAYALGLILFLLILLVEALTPLSMHIPPIWEVCEAVGATYLIMSFVDDERPLRSLAQTLLVEVRTPRPAKTRRTLLRPGVRVDGGTTGIEPGSLSALYVPDGATDVKEPDQSAAWGRNPRPERWINSRST